MDALSMIGKYHHLPITANQFTHSLNHAGPYARALSNDLLYAAAEIARIEDALRAAADTLHRAATRATAAIDAQPGQPIPQLNPLGELQNTGLQFDILIAQRDNSIEHLRVLVDLWPLLQQHITAPAAPGPLNPAPGAQKS